jgi:hypothetical protein
MTAITPSGTTISANNANTGTLQYNTNYYLYAYCSNDIPESTNFVSPTLAYVFNLGLGPSNTTINTNTTNNTNSGTNTGATVPCVNGTYPNGTNCTNASNAFFISYGIVLIFSLLLFIL